MELLRPYARTPRDLNPERFRDDLTLLRYSLRSLELYAPWVRNVYLLTCRPQVPSWLRREHPKLRIAHHDELVTEAGVLPTFNSNVIESFLDRLPGISRHFLYCNDDHLLGAPVSPSDFFAADGRMKIRGTLLGHPLRFRAYERQVIPFGLLEHRPMLIDRELWRGMQQAEPSDFAELRRHRFRQPDDLRCDRLYRWFALRHAGDLCVAEPFWQTLRICAFHKIKRDLARERLSLADLARRKAKFICLNDDQGEDPNPEVTSLVRSFLEESYPRPSSFEVSGA
jgi:hypothetical protein